MSVYYNKPLNQLIMTKADLIVKGKTLGLTLSNSMLKADMETAIKKAEAKPKVGTDRRSGEN